MDGSALATIPPADLYTLVGGLVDASVDAAADSGDPTVLLTSRRQGTLFLLAASISDGDMPSSGALGPARSIATRLGGTLTVGPGQACVLFPL